MPNILMIAPFQSKSGWGEASCDMARAMKLAGLDISIFDMRLDQSYVPIPDDLQDVFKKPVDNPEFLIQKLLPEYFYYDGRFKYNIGNFVIETNEIDNHWPAHCEMMDALMFNTQKECNLFPDHKTYAVGECVNPIKSFYFPEVNSFKHSQRTYVFYTIAEHSDRKNLKDLITGYISEFSYKDDVALVIKTNDDSLKDKIIHYKKTFRKRLDINLYPPIYTISDYMSEQELQDLHEMCDCFVTTSRGEAFCRPLADAVCHLNEVLYTEGIGCNEYMGEAGHTIKAYKVPCRCEQPPTHYHYNLNESWQQVDILDLQYKMRERYHTRQYHYENNTYKDFLDNLSLSYNPVIDKIDYQRIGNNIKKCLDSLKK